MRNGAYTKIPNIEQPFHSLQMKSRFDAPKFESERASKKPHKLQHGLLGFVALLLTSAVVLMMNIFKQPNLSSPDFVRYLYYSDPRGGLYSQTFLQNLHDFNPMLRRNVARLIESQYTAVGKLIDPACILQSLLTSNQESTHPNPQLNQETFQAYLQKLYRDAADEQMYGCLLNDLDEPPPINWRSGPNDDTNKFYMGHLPQDLSDPMPSSEYKRQNHCPTDFYGSYSTLDPYGVFNDTIPGQWFQLAADLPYMLEPSPEQCTIKKTGQALKDALRMYLTTRVSGIWMPPVVNTTGTPVGVLNSGRMVAIHEYAKVETTEKPVDTSDSTVVADVEMVCSSLAALDSSARNELSKLFKKTESWNEYMDETLMDVLEVCQRAFDDAVKQLGMDNSDNIREDAQIQRMYVVSLLSMHQHIAYKKMYALQPPVLTGERVATWEALVQHVKSTDAQTPPMSQYNEYMRLPGVSRGEAVLFESIASRTQGGSRDTKEKGKGNQQAVSTPTKQDILDSGIIKSESARKLLEDRPDIFEKEEVCNEEGSVCIDISVLLQIYQAPREVQRRAVRALGLGWGIMYKDIMVNFMQLALDMYYVRKDYAVSEVFLIGPPKTGSTAQFQCLAGAFHQHYACANDACVNDPSIKYWAHSPQNLGSRSIEVKEPRTVRANLKSRHAMAEALQSPTMYSPKSKFYALPAHPVDVDATTDYLHYPWAPLVMYFVAPNPRDLKFGAVHRDPADRFYSHYSMRLQWHKNDETVEESFSTKLAKIEQCYDEMLQAHYADGWESLKQQYPNPENETQFSDGPLGYPDAYMNLPFDIFLLAQGRCYFWDTLEVYASIYEFAYKNYFSLFSPSQLTVQDYQEEKKSELISKLENISELTGMYLNPSLVEELQAKLEDKAGHTQNHQHHHITQPVDKQDSFAMAGASFKEGRPVDIDTVFDLCSSTQAMSFAQDDEKEQSQPFLERLRERYASHERIAQDLLKSNGVL